MAPLKTSFKSKLKASLKENWKTAVILLIIGLTLSFLLMAGSMAFDWVTVANVTFIVGMVYLVWGMIHLIGNMNVFASMVFGLRTLKNIFFGKRSRDPVERKLTGNEEYLEYLESRPHHGDVPMMLILAVIFIALSVLASLASYR